ncbi:hypothetical protein [Kineosporia sp. NBRC 101731]|uniref:hypothetical protein n=1 Tax=Kineosporia sp. NBRC 101731 TaxID=3032199 RepID=UPI0025558209|nr:hypothetical protein [Kineosporia sp. NBRC 101731]
MSSPDVSSRTPGGRRASGWWWVGVVMAVAVALLVFVHRDDENSGSADPVAVELPQEPVATDGNPHLFMKDARWRLTSLSQDDERSGSQVFTLAGRTVTITWYPSRVADLVLSSRRADLRERDPLTIFGRRATVLEDALNQEVLFTSGSAFITVRVHGVRDRDAFTAVLSELQVLEPARWEDSLGPDVVRPEQSPEVAGQMLSDVPIPDDFDTSTLATRFSEDRTTFGGRVLGSVGCAWLGEYLRAYADQDEKKMAAVYKALSGYQQWSLQREINARAEAPDSGILLLSGKVGTRQDASEYVDLLGCDRDGR